LVLSIFDTHVALVNVGLLCRPSGARGGFCELTQGLPPGLIFIAPSGLTCLHLSGNEQDYPGSEQVLNSDQSAGMKQDTLLGNQ
jgi:hypothetical protein